MKKRLSILISLTLAASGVCLLLFWGDARPDRVPITTRSASARMQFFEGRTLFEQMRNAAAETYLARAVELDPQFALAHLYLYRVQANGTESRNSLSRAVSLVDRVSDGERLLILADRAGAYQLRGRQEELLDQLVNAYPLDARTHCEKADFFFLRKRWADAMPYYIAAIELTPGFTRPHNGLGYCCRFLGNLQEAEEHFLRYMQLIPDAPNPFDSYADLLTEMNRHREAIQFYKAALEVQPDFTASHLGIANNLCLLGLHDEAREQLHRLLELAGKDSQRRRALQGLTLTYLDQGDFEAAFRQFDVTREIAVAAADTVAMAQDLDDLGLMWLEVGHPEEASRAFTAALNLIVALASAPSVVEQAQLDHTQRMALVWLRRGDVAQAQELVLQYRAEALRIQDHSRTRTAHQTLGVIALESGNAQLAVQELSKSDLDQAYNQYYLALAHEASGDIAQALRFHLQASTYDQFDRLGQTFVRRKALQRVESLRLAQRPHREAAKL